MDAFKKGEMGRMERGGNGRWRDFWSEKSGGREWGKARPEEGNAMSWFEERYAGEVGEEWKERLGYEVEGRAFDERVFREEVEERRKRGLEKEKRMQSPLGGGKSQKEINEAFFARKGGENESRPDNLPPSQGGKYGGFGSQMPEPTGGGKGEGGVPGMDEFQKDPVKALTKGFGWFTTTVGKGAKTVNDSYIQPNVQKVCIPPSPPWIPTPFTLPTFYSLPYIPTFYSSISAEKQTALTPLTYHNPSSPNPISPTKPASPPHKSARTSRQAPRTRPSSSTALLRIRVLRPPHRVVKRRRSLRIRIFGTRLGVLSGMIVMVVVTR